FCRSCYETLRQQLESTIQQMSADIPYPAAAVGAVLGGAAGALLWWGFTVVTHIAFGLVAVAIGFLVGHGAVRFAGGKRSQGLQLLAVGVALASFAVATYLVNMTFINAALVKQGGTHHVPFPPTSGAMAFSVLSAGFGLMDVVFLAITLWEAWKIPMPLRLPKPSAP
ncbi:MAG TPA: hypothetical protein VLV15_04275, partial [Dongiaceae bacterium]|nr:hypothetical protein [Dongiaceae bacterium]